MAKIKKTKMKVRKLRKNYDQEEKRHDKKYEKENSLHEKRHRVEIDEALRIGIGKKKSKSP